MILIKLIYFAGLVQTAYFFLLLTVPLSVTLRKMILYVLFHSRLSAEFNRIQLIFLSVYGVFQQYGFLESEKRSSFNQSDKYSIEQQYRLNFNKALKYFYLSFFILSVNLCIFGYTLYLRKLDKLQDKINAIKQHRKELMASNKNQDLSDENMIAAAEGKKTS